MKTEFTPGQEVYDIHGRAGRFVARSGSGYIVEPAFEQEEDKEQWFGDAVTWRQIFAKPPVEKLHAEVAELEKQADAARADLAKVREERNTLDKEHRARLERLKKFQHLSRIDDYIEGRITHFVVARNYGSAVAVLTFDQVMKNTERGSSYVNLLTLRGTDTSYMSNEWQRREFYASHWCVTGGSSEGWVIPCTSREEATEKACTRTLELFAELRKKTHFMHGIHDSAQLVKAASALGMDIPEDIAASANLYAKSEAAKMVAKAQRELESANASVARAQAELAKAEGGAA